MQKSGEKSAFIAIVGRPNTGKSSILNAMLGQKVAIVSPKPQTTRTRIMGIHTDGEIQLVFVDTPGLHLPKDRLGESMVKAVGEGLRDAEVCVLVVDANVRRDANGEIIIPAAETELVTRFGQSRQRAILALNKTDTVKNKKDLLSVIAAYSKMYDFDEIIPLSARKGDNIPRLLEQLYKYAVPSPHFFDEDALTDQPQRVLAAEILREKLLYLLDREIPHGLAVSVEKYAEREGILDIEMVIYCEKASHKGIIIGKGGEKLKRVGELSRRDVERFMGTKVFLQTWVKVKENWRDSQTLLNNFGFRK